MSALFDFPLVEQQIRALDATAWAFDPFEHGRRPSGVSAGQQAGGHRGCQVVELRRVRELIPEVPQQLPEASGVRTRALETDHLRGRATSVDRAGRERTGDAALSDERGRRVRGGQRHVQNSLVELPTLRRRGRVIAQLGQGPRRGLHEILLSRSTRDVIEEHLARASVQVARHLLRKLERLSPQAQVQRNARARPPPRQ